MTPYLTTEEVAKILRLSPATVAIYFCTGKIRGKKIGGNWLTTEENIQEVMNL